MSLSEYVIEPSSSGSISSAAGSREKASGVRVLLVEGDPLIRAMLAAVLAKQGFDVESFDEHPATGHRSPSERVLQDGALPAAPGFPPRAAHGGKIARDKLLIDLAQRRAWWDDVEVPLTGGEFRIVALLASEAGCFIDNRTIYDCLRQKGLLAGRGENGFWANVRSVVRRIRSKFRGIDSSFDEIETAYAFGYRWRMPG